MLSQLLISVVILVTSGVCYSSAVHISSLQFNHLSTINGIDDGDVSELSSPSIQEFSLASDGPNNISDEPLTLPSFASTNSIASGDESYLPDLPEEIWGHISTRSGMKIQDAVRLGAMSTTIRRAMRDILPSDARILNELCHFITTSGESTVKSILCRLPDINGDIDKILSDKISSDKIRLQLRALNHLLEGKANQININIEGHRDDDKRKAAYLMLAAEDGLVKIVQLLLEHHANVHAADDYALRDASFKGRREVVELLLKHGANVHADNDSVLRRASA